MEAFEAGRWGEAVGLGREGSTVDDRIAAARAGSVIASYVTRDKEEARRLLAQAVADAEAAVAIQPESGRARVERALVGGFLAKLERSPGRAKGARADAEAALQKDGNDALAHAVLGGWHLESVATLGSLVGRTLLGARESEGRKRFERAIALDPGSVLYPVFYAFALLSLDPMEAPKAAELLVKADRAKPRDAYERLVQANGRQVLVELQKGEPYRARDLAKRLSPLGKLA
jgi:predicted Zn-dependent protease